MLSLSALFMLRPAATRAFWSNRRTLAAHRIGEGQTMTVKKARKNKQGIPHPLQAAARCSNEMHIGVPGDHSRGRLLSRPPDAIASDRLGSLLHYQLYYCIRIPYRIWEAKHYALQGT